MTEAQESHYLDGQGSLRLEEGDSILWDGTLPYRVENIGNNDVRLLIAVAPASLWKHGGEEASNGISTPVQVDSLEHSARRDQSVQEYRIDWIYGEKFQEVFRKMLGLSALDRLPSINVSTKKGGACTLRNDHRSISAGLV